MASIRAFTALPPASPAALGINRCAPANHIISVSRCSSRLAGPSLPARQVYCLTLLLSAHCLDLPTMQRATPAACGRNFFTARRQRTWTHCLPLNLNRKRAIDARAMQPNGLTHPVSRRPVWVFPSQSAVFLCGQGICRHASGMWNNICR